MSLVFSNGWVTFDSRDRLLRHNSVNNNGFALAFFDIHGEVFLKIFLVKPLFLGDDFDSGVCVVLYLNG